MKLELITWKITGVRPLMQDNPIGMSREEEGSQGGTRKPQVKSRLKESEDRLYLDEEGRPYMPAIAFWRCLFVACPNRTLGKKAAAGVIAASVSSIEDRFLLLDPNTLEPLKADGFMVDTRRVVNKKKGAILASRPMWKKWAGLLTLEVDRDFLPQPEGKSELTGLEGLTGLMNIAGRFGVGVGRMRQVEGKSEWGGLGLGKFSAELFSPIEPTQANGEEEKPPKKKPRQNSAQTA